MRSLTIAVPMLPPSDLSLNSFRKLHWGHIDRARTRFKQAVHFAVCQVRDGWIAPEKAQVDLIFVYSTKRRRDQTNLMVMWKSGEDILVQDGIIVDDDMEHVVTMPPKVEIDKERAPMLIIQVSEV